jgi:hypothetical protein
VAFVGVGQVASAFVGDGFFAVLGAGLLAARHLQAAHGVVEKLDGAIDDRRCGRPGHRVGNYNRLPGWVVYFCHWVRSSRRCRRDAVGRANPRTF